MNKVMLVGRIANDLELRAIPNGNSVCEFNLATNRPVVRDGERQADFITCVVWGKLAENLVNYQSKGSLIGISGSMRVDTYDKSDGTRGYKTYVLVNDVEFLGTKKSEAPAEPPIEEVKLNNIVNDVNPYEEFGQQIAISEEIDMDSLPF